jgi:hypothetical protein
LVGTRLETLLGNAERLLLSIFEMTLEKYLYLVQLRHSLEGLVDFNSGASHKTYLIALKSILRCVMSGGKLTGETNPKVEWKHNEM